jgi:hypothetical protein
VGTSGGQPKIPIVYLFNAITMASLTELFEFLSSPNPAARHLALQNLVGHTPKNSPNRHIFIPSSFAGSGVNGGGLKGAGSQSAASGSEDEAKVQALRDLCDLCRDQAVSLFHSRNFLS